MRRMLKTLFKRNSKARRICIDSFGTACTVCGFDFGETYGPGQRYLHSVDPVADLRPLCQLPCGNSSKEAGIFDR